MSVGATLQMKAEGQREAQEGHGCENFLDVLSNLLIVPNKNAYSTRL